MGLGGSKTTTTMQLFLSLDLKASCAGDPNHPSFVQIRENEAQSIEELQPTVLG